MLIWILLRKKQIWTSIRHAKLFQISLVGTAFTYFFSILIARRVFSLDHLAMLPNEANVHVASEEVLENIAHLFLAFSGIVAFFSINKQHRKHAKKAEVQPLSTKPLTINMKISYNRRRWPRVYSLIIKET